MINKHLGNYTLKELIRLMKGGLNKKEDPMTEVNTDEISDQWYRIGEPEDVTIAPLNEETKWNYTLDEDNIILSQYVAPDENSVVYDRYIIDGKRYKTKINNGLRLFPSKYCTAVVKTITFSDHIDFSEMTNCYMMFERLTNTISIDFGKGFDTSNVTDMSYMFYGGYKLTSLDLTSWDTSKVTSFMNMFSGCTNLKQILVSRDKWVIRDDCNTTNMFNNCGCSDFTYVD